MKLAQRTHEIGIRMALGADRAGILSMIARQSLHVAAVGITLGLGAAKGLSRLMRGMLYQIDPADPATFTAVAAVLLIFAILAALFKLERQRLLRESLSIAQIADSLSQSHQDLLMLH